MPVKVTDLDRKLFKNIPPECPPAPEGKETFQIYMANALLDKLELMSVMGHYEDIIDLMISDYEKTGLAATEGIYRFPVQQSHPDHSQGGEELAKLYLNGYFGSMGTRWRYDEKWKGRERPSHKRFAEWLKTMDNAGPYIPKCVCSDTIGDFVSMLFLALLFTLGAVILWLLLLKPELVLSWLPLGDALQDFLQEFMPVVGWLPAVTFGIISLFLLGAAFGRLSDLFHYHSIRGEREYRLKEYTKAYKEALGYVRLRQLFCQHITGKENKELARLQQLVEKHAKDYVQWIKW